MDLSVESTESIVVVSVSGVGMKSFRSFLEEIRIGMIRNPSLLMSCFAVHERGTVSERHS